jgi:hypothetical protein
MNLAKILKSIVTEANTLNDYLSSRGINPKFVSRDTKISHAKSALFQKWKSDRKMAEETILEASESELLAKYLNSRGINPKFATKDMKIAHSKSGEFMKWKRDHQHFELDEGVDKKDTVVLDIPLLIRVLELAREDIKSDADLHRVVEKLISIRNKGVLTMDDYNTIANINENHIAIAMGNMLDDEGSMVLSQLEQLERAISMIRSHIGKDYEKQLPAWVQAKITLATDYADTVGNYITSKNEKVTEEVKKPTGELKTACWKGYTAVGLKKKNGKSVPNCVPEETEITEAKMPRTTALDRWRKAAAEREIKHNNIEKKRQEKLHQDPSKVTIPVANTQKDDLTTAIDRLEKHLNKEEVELDEMINEVLGKDATAGDWIHDFIHSDNPKFAGKSKAERKKMALGAYYGKQNEEFEQLDELKKSTVFSWLKQQPVVPEKKPGMDKKAHNKRIKTRSKSWNRALDRLAGYKPTSENTLDSLAATEAPSDNSDMTNGTTSKAAKMVKDLKKKTVKEETYDWEKDDKSSMEKPYGKAPKINVTDKKGTLGDTKPEARAVMKGGTTLTGQPRDMVEIDPSMKQRPGQDKGQSTFTSPTGKKSPSL